MTRATAKQALREELLLARLRLSPEDRAARSAAICDRLLALEPFRAARTLAAYVAIGAEVDPAAAVAAAVRSGCRVAWPRVVAGSRLLAFAACPPDRLVPGARATREPPADAPEVPLEEIDCMLVPGVAFDPAGRRLGRGGGYYDATLAALPARAPRLGVAFDFQVVPEVPGEPHDVEVEAIVTDARIVRARDPR